MAKVNIQQHRRDEFLRDMRLLADDLTDDLIDDSIAMFGRLSSYYVRGTMYYRYFSELLTAFIARQEYYAGNADFNYAELSDDDAMSKFSDGDVASKFWYLISNLDVLWLKPSELFCNVCKRADKDPDLNETLEKIFKKFWFAIMIQRINAPLYGKLCDDCYLNKSTRIGADGATKRNKCLVKLLWGIRDMKLGTISNIETYCLR